MRKLKMTREELRREMKESEGSPEVKGRIRQLQQQMANRRMMEAVPTADVVVVNPTHYAVALKYEGGAMNAPTVVALGVETALRIREVADGNKVAIVSAPPLARALYREGQLGKEIPVRLYSAVAQVRPTSTSCAPGALARCRRPAHPGG
jgi:flagellar biosynthetic protein FlhB